MEWLWDASSKDKGGVMSDITPWRCNGCGKNWGHIKREPRPKPKYEPLIKPQPKRKNKKRKRKYPPAAVRRGRRGKDKKDS